MIEISLILCVMVEQYERIPPVHSPSGCFSGPVIGGCVKVEQYELIPPVHSPSGCFSGPVIGGCVIGAAALIAIGVGIYCFIKKRKLSQPAMARSSSQQLLQQQPAAPTTRVLPMGRFLRF